MIGLGYVVFNYISAWLFSLSFLWWSNSIQSYQWKPQGAVSICFVFIYGCVANFGSYFKDSRLKMTTKPIQELVGLCFEKRIDIRLIHSKISMRTIAMIGSGEFEHCVVCTPSKLQLAIDMIKEL